MAERRRASWGEGELYELLCLMMVGTCCWIVGVQLGAFRALDALLTTYALSDLFMLGFFMGLGAFAASINKSVRLRRIMRERDAAEAQAATVARHDPLTGLANRRLFLDAVEERRARGTASNAAVFLIDLDRFKPINDLYGHAAGNAVLCAVAERLEGLLPRGGVAARLGGDEFAVMVELTGGSEGLSRLAQRLIGAIATPVLWERNELKVGATVGIALAAGAVDAEAVMHAADLAMYQGKKDGRGTYRV